MRGLCSTTVDLHWQQEGDPDGQPVVFANSLGTDLRIWDAVIELLPREGIRYIRFDNRGHGLSACPSSPYTMGELADDAEAVLDHLEVTDCLFVGLSIGGMIGQLVASRNPGRIKGLVLSNTAAKMGEPAMWRDRIAAIETGGLGSLVDAILDRWFGAAYRGSSENRIWRAMLTRTPAQGYIGCCEAIANADLHATTAQLRLPVLGIGGSEDKAIPPDLVKATADLVPGSRFVELAGAGHLPCVEAPKVYAAHLMSFFTEASHV
ncbi:3-oxoadipate enol-lactonase [Roseibium sp. TrichSKD4]|uniref:3-oxoadipate enol-lactonase n=1 Tax=Roseibium sp. TrichSKD4 TaxID=744980 RepID=UPI0001E56E3C|nr:3-oxoadipate enol-lactonase [Roseibium sp. TrichSKD4]EFO30301.1 3-oxoadipate enol-lactonase [Roseibium sp. TrichSKD4]